MYMTVVFSILGLTLPIFIALVVFQLGLYAAWVIISVYIGLLSVIFWFRFQSGKWKTMKVIETETFPEEPLAEEVQSSVAGQ